MQNEKSSRGKKHGEWRKNGRRESVRGKSLKMQATRYRVQGTRDRNNGMMENWNDRIQAKG